MNKKDLIEFVFDKCGKKVSRKIVSDVVTAVMDGMLYAVSKGDAVKLVGFMNITLKHYGERPARNPKTGVVSKIPPSVKASAKLGAMFKEAVKKVKPVVASSSAKAKKPK